MLATEPPALPSLMQRTCSFTGTGDVSVCVRGNFEGNQARAWRDRKAPENEVTSLHLRFL